MVLDVHTRISSGVSPTKCMDARCRAGKKFQEGDISKFFHPIVIHLLNFSKETLLYDIAITIHSRRKIAALFRCKMAFFKRAWHKEIVLPRLVATEQ